MSIKILIVDDHIVVREGMKTFINYQPDMLAVGEAENGEEAIHLAEKLKPDIVLLDLVMPVRDGISAIEPIKKVNPDGKIIVLTSFSEDDKVFPAIEKGALGYLIKDSPPRELLAAIRAVHRGESVLHPTIARKVVRQLSAPQKFGKPGDELTNRETEILTFVAQGMSNQQICEQIGVSDRTIRNYISNILSKLGLENRVQAALFALREGLVTLDETDGLSQ
jgi:NarL family two-component system response regulator LiaR